MQFSEPRANTPSPAIDADPSRCDGPDDRPDSPTKLHGAPAALFHTQLPHCPIRGPREKCSSETDTMPRRMAWNGSSPIR